MSICFGQRYFHIQEPVENYGCGESAFTSYELPIGLYYRMSEYSDGAIVRLFILVFIAISIKLKTKNLAWPYDAGNTLTVLSVWEAFFAKCEVSSIGPDAENSISFADEKNESIELFMRL